MGTIANSFGKTEFVETDGTNLAFNTNNVTRMVVNGSGNVTLGTNDGTGAGDLNCVAVTASGLGTFETLWVNSSEGVSEDFYTEGDAKITGYLNVETITGASSIDSTNASLYTITPKGDVVLIDGDVTADIVDATSVTTFSVVSKGDNLDLVAGSALGTIKLKINTTTVLYIDESGNISLGSSAGAGTGSLNVGDINVKDGDVSLQLGSQISIGEGSNGIMGVATVQAITGIATVSTDKIQSDSRIFLTPTNDAGAGSAFNVYASNIDPSASFDIVGVGLATDCVVNWLLINPA